MSERDYLDLLERTVEEGTRAKNRTGIDTLRLRGHHALSFDMSDGSFPLLTTKKMPWKSIRVELEFFIKGLTDKRWLQERGCHFWDEWCDPTLVEKLPPEERKEAAKTINELGPIYGSQWRHFNSYWGSDQLTHIVKELKTNPTNRQLVCSAWNPNQQHRQALPPCHVCWHVDTDGDQLNLCWFQRSCDAFLGVPCNIASYALLLRLLAREAGKEPGVLTGFFSNFHVYINHLEQIDTQFRRVEKELPKLYVPDVSIFNWTWDNCELIDYNPHDALKGDVAV